MVHLIHVRRRIKSTTSIIHWVDNFSLMISISHPNRLFICLVLANFLSIIFLYFDLFLLFLLFVCLFVCLFVFTWISGSAFFIFAIKRPLVFIGFYYYFLNYYFFFFVDGWGLSSFVFAFVFIVYLFFVIYPWFFDFLKILFLSLYIHFGVEIVFCFV